MPRPQRPPRPLPPVGDLTDRRGLGRMAEQFLDWSRVRGYSELTVFTRHRSLSMFVRWCETRGLRRPGEVTRAVLERYQRHLHYYRKQNGDPLSVGTQLSRLNPLRAWFKWMVRQGLLLLDPSAELELPRLPRRLPKHVLSEEEAERILALPNLGTAVGLRDRAIMELFYSTGIRRAELCRLALLDLDVERTLLRVRRGKGGKDRLIPLGQRAAAWVSKYIREGRPRHARRPGVETVFLTSLGQSLRPKHLTRLVGDYVTAADIGKQGSCHLFRHTMATMMLEGGADIRYVQQMLGHENLTATQLYTRVTVLKLREVHQTTHPGERRWVLGNIAASADGDSPETGAVPERPPQVPQSRSHRLGGHT